jgi:thioredoxin 1
MSSFVRYTQSNRSLLRNGVVVSYLRPGSANLAVFMVILYGAAVSLAQSQRIGVAKPASVDSSAPHTSFPPVEAWQRALASQNAVGLKSLYSNAPPAQITTPKGKSNPDEEVAFWTGLKGRKLKSEVVQSMSPEPGVQQVILNIEIRSAGSPRAPATYISEGQVWQQQDQQWRLVAVQRSDAARLQQPATKKDIYPAGIDAHAEINEALDRAAKERKHVLLVFGANWCYDCHVLDLAFHRPDIAPLLNSNFEVVHVDIGEGDKNQDLMKQYEVPKEKGIPALAVLGDNGKLLYSQKNGEFEKARALGPEDLVQFLIKWKPQAR